MGDERAEPSDSEVSFVKVFPLCVVMRRRNADESAELRHGADAAELSEHLNARKEPLHGHQRIGGISTCLAHGRLRIVLENPI